MINGPLSTVGNLMIGAIKTIVSNHDAPPQLFSRAYRDAYAYGAMIGYDRIQIRALVARAFTEAGK